MVTVAQATSKIAIAQSSFLGSNTDREDERGGLSEGSSLQFWAAWTVTLCEGGSVAIPQP